jgi:hypothetical protein
LREKHALIGDIERHVSLFGERVFRKQYQNAIFIVKMFFRKFELIEERIKRRADSSDSK